MSIISVRFDFAVGRDEDSAVVEADAVGGGRVNSVTVTCRKFVVAADPSLNQSLAGNFHCELSLV